MKQSAEIYQIEDSQPQPTWPSLIADNRGRERERERVRAAANRQTRFPVELVERLVLHY